MDSFPVQWMQLETLMAVTPDPKIDRYFSLDGQYPATALEAKWDRWAEDNQVTPLPKDLGAEYLPILNPGK